MAPYLNMLSEWIYKGRLVDAYGEFSVTAEEGLRADALPEFLLKSAAALLSCGKSVRVLERYAPEHYLLQREPPVLQLSFSQRDVDRYVLWVLGRII